MLKASKRNHVVASRFGRQAQRYNAHANLQADVARELASHLPDITNPHVLEIGCGTGHLTEHLLKRYPFGDFTITDLSRHMLDQCRLRFPICGQRAYAVLDGEWPDTDRHFDLIATSMAVHWFEDPLPALDRLTALLRPGGKLLYATLGHESFNEWRKLLREESLPIGLVDLPKWPGVLTEEYRKIPYDNGLSFLKAMKAMGATAPRTGYRPLTVGALRNVLRKFDTRADRGITWHIVYGELQV